MIKKDTQSPRRRGQVLVNGVCSEGITRAWMDTARLSIAPLLIKEQTHCSRHSCRLPFELEALSVFKLDSKGSSGR